MTSGSSRTPCSCPARPTSRWPTAPSPRSRTSPAAVATATTSGLVATLDLSEPSGDPVPGEIWTATLDGNSYRYTTQLHDTLADVANGLAIRLRIGYANVIVTTVPIAGQPDIQRIIVTKPGGTPITATLVVGGLASITDENATHVNAATGQRPGFDPRFNGFPYSVTFLNGPAQNVELDVASTSSDILSVGRSDESFHFGFAHDGQPATAQDARFIGVPDPAQDLTAIHWNEAIVQLTGSPTVGDVWTIALTSSTGAVSTYAYTVEANQDVLSRVATKLADLINADTNARGYHAEIRIGLLGEAYILLIARDGSAFRVTGRSITEAPDSPHNTGTILSGDPILADVPGVAWTMAAVAFKNRGNTGDTWAITLTDAAGSHTYSYQVKATDSIADITNGLAALIPAAFAPVVSGTKVTFTTAWPLDANGSDIQPQGTLTLTASPTNAGGTSSISSTGGITITALPDPSAFTKAFVTFAVPAVSGDVWTLTIDGRTYSYTTVAGESRRVRRREAPGDDRPGRRLRRDGRREYRGRVLLQAGQPEHAGHRGRTRSTR